MDDIFNKTALYRILQGRLRYQCGDLVLYIYEPTRDIIEESLAVYDEAYRKAYFTGVYIKSELVEVLVNNDLWSPFDDREADKIEKQIEELKVQAFKAFFKKKELRVIKRGLRQLEKELIKYRSKKLCLDHVSCEGVALLSQSIWVIAQTTRDVDGNLYNWSDMSISSLMRYCDSNQITTETFRAIARSEPWRSMWVNGKQQSNIFGKPTCDLSGDQMALCRYSIMYDNVYENTDSPDDDVIQDDDCLDGWFIVQRRKYEIEKTKRETEDLLGNSKIANSQEVFIMAPDQEAANKLYDLNDPVARSVVRSRQHQKDQHEGQLDFREFTDVKQDIAMAQRQAYINKAKGGR